MFVFQLVFFQKKLTKIYIFVKNSYFGQKSKFFVLVKRWKMENLDKNRKFGQKWKIWTKIENLAKNRKFEEKSKIWTKIRNLAKNRKLEEKSKI